MATRAAGSEFLRVWSDPQGFAERLAYAPITSTYVRRWARYSNSIFEDRLFWSDFMARNGLYKKTRAIFNPARGLGEFYSSIIYPGVLAMDGKRLPDGTPLAIPLEPDIDPALREAIGQLWQWSNWQDGMGVYTLYGSVLGDVGIDVVDEVDRGKVTFDITHPGIVKDLELDLTGNVKSHAIEYQAVDDNGKKYTYRKEVDGERIAEYKDNELFRYDENIPAERANPYGFDPFIWCRHRNVGSEYGAPALRNEQNVDELNSLASHAYDRSHAILSSPVLVSGAQSGAAKALGDAGKRPGTTTSSLLDDHSDRESIRFITADEGAAMASIELSEGEVAARIAELQENIEREHPELTMYQKLREMSQVTGPAAEILIGDTANFVIRARASYDTQTIKLHQMAIAISGWRANEGHWGRNLSRQQEAFLPFNLDSYNRGDLEFSIMPRPIVPHIRLSPDEQRALMEQGDRGYALPEQVIEALGHDPEETMAGLEAARAAQPVTETPTTMDELALALQQNQQGAT